MVSSDKGGAVKASLKNKKGVAKKTTEEYVIDPAKLLKYTRGKKVKAKQAKDRRLRGKLKAHENKYEQSVKQAARSELLMTETAGSLETEGIEKTYNYKQADIASALNITSAQKFFDLNLDKFGPYKIDYTKNGKFLLIGGAKGHLAAIDWTTKNLACEIHAQEAVRDVVWLHQETMFATAQKKYVHIYDNQGTELHCLKDHKEVNRLEYLPYHFLLCSVGNQGYLKYQDTSTGKLVSELRTKLGRCDCMTQNPYNSVINLGHHNGTVTMWSPTMKEPLIKMLCHRGAVLSISVEKQGFYMATSGLDGLLKLWDIRNYKSIYSYRMKGRPAHCTAISQKGMIAAAFGPQVYVFKDALTEKHNLPYMKHVIPGADITSIRFCPFEDVLGIGHSKGFSSLIIPGAGEPNFDALESNPFQTKKQRQEHEVKKLLEKIQPDMITLNPNDIHSINSTGSSESKETKDAVPFEPKYKMKGRNKSGKIEKRKKGVAEISKRDQLKEKNLEEKRKQLKDLESGRTSPIHEETKSTLDRFM